ncbi:site-specific integrase [Luteibacter sp. 9133]|uniref:site-specific integrase n=1 Tax=Luteibacter sp. 9133 TaxID=1500891 RepID=UPI0005B7AFC4|nr:site-specific integrase [Luteibacter sp. 9133]
MSDAERADAVILDVDAAPPAQLLRQFHGRTADGSRVSMYSQRGPEEVRDILTRRAGQPLVHFRWSHSDVPFGAFEPQSTARERHLAALGMRGPLPAAVADASDDLAPVLPVAPAVVPTSITVGGQSIPLEAVTAILASLGMSGGAIGGFGAPAPLTPPSPPSNVRLTDRIAPFLSFVEQKKTSRSLLVDHAATLRMFIETVGDKRVAELGPTDLDAFLAVLRRWPAHAAKRREYRKLDAKAVVRKADILKDPAVDVRTQQGYIDRLRRFFLWLEQRQEIRPGLMKGIRLISKRTPFTRPRQPFDTHELVALFSAPRLLSMRSPAHYWLPLLALYTGLRLRELAQLYLADVVEHGGRWFLYVSDGRKGQRIKTRSSNRMVPLHDAVVKAGFLDYVDEARGKGIEVLFPGLNWNAANGPGDTISDWFSRTLRKHVGITDPARTFHSFRHTFATFASRSGLRDGLIAELLGHDTSHNTLNTYYVALANLPEKCWGIDHIQFPSLCHPPYQRGHFDGAFDAERRRMERHAKVGKTFGR